MRDHARMLWEDHRRESTRKRVPRVAAEPSPANGPDEDAQRTADRLALALEAVGFDVGIDFPGLRSGWDESGAPGVRLGAVTCRVASNLTALLVGATAAGVVLRPG
jgi:hypothetical protein